MMCLTRLLLSCYSLKNLPGEHTGLATEHQACQAAGSHQLSPFFLQGAPSQMEHPPGRIMNVIST